MYPRIPHALLLAEFDIDKGSTLRTSVPIEFMSALPLDANVIAELCLPEGGHNRSDDSTVFIFNREKGQYTVSIGAEAAEAADTAPLLFVYSVVMTRRDDSVRRGAVMRSLALVSRYQFLDQFHAVMVAALERYFAGPDPSVLSSFYDALCAVDISTVPKLTKLERAVMRACVPSERKCLSDIHPTQPSVSFTHRATVPYAGAEYAFSIPLNNEADVLSTASISLLFEKFGKGVATIYNAILLEKRVLFCGDKSTSASDVGRCVIAACALMSPTLSCVFRRAFPYACLTQLDFLSQPGFIAGVTNPMFASKPMWFDVVANFATGEVMTAAQANAALSTGSSTSGPSLPPSPDVVAIFGPDEGPEWKPLEEVVFEKIVAGVPFGESWLRDSLHTHTAMLFNLCSKFVSLRDAAVATPAPTADPAGKPPTGAPAPPPQPKIMTINATRLTSLAKTSQFAEFTAGKALQLDLAGTCFHKGADPSGDLRSHIAALKSGAYLKKEALRQVYRELCERVTSSRDVEGLVVMMPESLGGLHAVATGLLNADPAIRGWTWKLLQRVESHANPAVRACFTNLNMYVMMAYQRVGQQLKDQE